MAIYPVEVEAHPTFQDGAFLEDQLHPGPLGPQGPARTGLWQQLLHAAGQEARTRGCHQIVLSSFSFQAPAFYQALGFEVCAALEEHPWGHQHYYLRKRLA